MAAPKKVRWAQLRVGVMAIAAMLIAAMLIFLLTSQTPVWRHWAMLYTYLDDSAALTKGAPVRLNGILIGSVDEVELSGSNEPNRIVRISMRVESAHLKDIPADSIAGISAETVLATKYINISKGRSAVPVQPNAELKAEPSTELQDLVKKGFNLFDSAQAILQRMDKIIGLVESGQGSIGKFLVDDEFYNRLTLTVAEMQKVAETIGSGRGTVGKLLYDESLYEEARSSIAQLDRLIADLQAGQGTAGKLLKDDALYNETRATVAQMHQLLDDINAGKGTAGKLLKDETAYKQIQGVLGKMDTTLDRVNSGQGTLGQLLVNPQLYESMRGMSSELQALVKDIRANPKKFLRMKMSLF